MKLNINAIMVGIMAAAEPPTLPRALISLLLNRPLSYHKTTQFILLVLLYNLPVQLVPQQRQYERSIPLHVNM